MKRLLPSCVGLALLLTACTSTKPATTTKAQPAGVLSYKISSNTLFKHLDASYLNAKKQGIVVQDITDSTLILPIGEVFPDFIGSISCTGYGASDSMAMFKLQILMDGKMVAADSIYGRNPSLAISYIVE